MKQLLKPILRIRNLLILIISGTLIYIFFNQDCLYDQEKPFILNYQNIFKAHTIAPVNHEKYDFLFTENNNFVRNTFFDHETQQIQQRESGISIISDITLA